MVFTYLAFAISFQVAAIDVVGSPEEVKWPRKEVGYKLTEDGVTLKLEGPGAVTIEGDVQHEVVDVTESRALTPGGYFASADGVPHSLTCSAESHCLIYVRTEGQFRLE